MIMFMAKRKKKKKKVSDKLRVVIDSCGVTRYRISQETGIAEATLSRFMVGQCGLSMKALDRLGEYLDLEVTLKRKKRP